MTLSSGGGGCYFPQERGLTCNASASRKRTLDDLPMAALPAHLRYPAHAAAGLAHMSGAAAAESGVTSTSGRPPATAADIVSRLYNQNLEIDALVRLQSERLQATLEEARKKHCLMLLSALEQHVIRRLQEKEAELESAAIRNADLEEKIRQMSAENQIWFNVAKNNEALVSTLRTSLEQVLENAAAGGGGAAAADLKEGFGDSDDGSSCFFDGRRRPEGEEEPGRRGACRVCGERGVSVLLLPCRHLCLCKACESKSDTCPVCRSTRNGSIQIFLS